MSCFWSLLFLLLIQWLCAVLGAGIRKQDSYLVHYKCSKLTEWIIFSCRSTLPAPPSWMYTVLDEICEGLAVQGWKIMLFRITAINKNPFYYTWLHISISYTYTNRRQQSSSENPCGEKVIGDCTGGSQSWPLPVRYSCTHKSKEDFRFTHFLSLSGFTGLEIRIKELSMLAKLSNWKRPNPHATFTGATAEAGLFLNKINVMQMKV